MDVAGGALQDKTPGQQYDRVFIMIMVLKGYDFFLGPFYDWVDGKWLGHQLRLPERIRRSKLVQQENSGRHFKGHERRTFWVILGTGVLAAMIITAWAVSLIVNVW